jgi:hypothetical protein
VLFKLFPSRRLYRVASPLLCNASHAQP